MRKPGRFLVPLTVIAVVVILTLVLSPTGAIGGERVQPTGAGDQFVFGRDAVVSSPVNGSLQVYGGNVEVQATVAGDLLAFGGNVVVTDRGRVNGNIIYAGGNVTGAEGRVRGRVFSLLTLRGAKATLNRTAVIVSLL